MRDIEAPTEAAWQYTEAYEAQYTAKDLRMALDLYQVLMGAHPDAAEAGYARAQVRNIAGHVIPDQELLEAQLEMAYTHLPREAPAIP